MYKTAASEMTYIVSSGALNSLTLRPLKASAAWWRCGCQGYRKRLDKLFERAGYKASAEQWRLQAEAAVGRTDEARKQESGEFSTLFECRSVSSSLVLYSL